MTQREPALVEAPLEGEAVDAGARPDQQVRLVDLHPVQAAQVEHEVVGVRARRRLVEAALTASTELSADQFVLASGRYISGGLVKHRVVREPVCDLGVFHEGARVDREWPLRLRHLEQLSPHPAFRTGVLTDDRLRPLDWDGLVAYDNLRAAGSLLGGYDFIRGYGFGVPMVTGWLAGRWSAIDD